MKHCPTWMINIIKSFFKYTSVCIQCMSMYKVLCSKHETHYVRRGSYTQMVYVLCDVASECIFWSNRYYGVPSRAIRHTSPHFVWRFEVVSFSSVLFVIGTAVCYHIQWCCLICFFSNKDVPSNSLGRFDKCALCAPKRCYGC
jgi:hypothetical protein